ncbi:12025_t:CDS:2, partial [Acaulospora colombiana]
EQNSQNSNRYIPEQIVLSKSNVNIPNPVISQCIAHASSTGTSSKLLEDDIPHLIYLITHLATK